MSCEKGGFVIPCHNNLRDITGKLLEEVCYDVVTEPVLEPVTDNLVPSTANTNDGARLDISARNFWITGQKAFFDVRLFDLNASRYQSKRILEVEHASFTALIFTVLGAVDIECRTFLSKLSELLAVKKDLPKSTVTSWVRTKISFALIRSM